MVSAPTDPAAVGPGLDFQRYDVLDAASEHIRLPLVAKLLPVAAASDDPLLGTHSPSARPPIHAAAVESGQMLGRIGETRWFL